MTTVATSTILNNAFKAKVLHAGIHSQESRVAEFGSRIREIMAHEKNEEHDPHQQSFRSEALTELSLLSDELELVRHELDELKHIRHDDEHSPLALYGAVVKTDRDLFFVSAGIERFYVEDVPVFGVSVQSPIYQAMKGKRVGDFFTHAGITHRIEAIL